MYELPYILLLILTAYTKHVQKQIITITDRHFYHYKLHNLCGLLFHEWWMETEAGAKSKTNVQIFGAYSANLNIVYVLFFSSILII